MINYQIQFNYKIKIIHEACWKVFFVVNIIAIKKFNPYHFKNYLKEMSSLAFSH
jgi:hypothetical protein